MGSVVVVVCFAVSDCVFVRLWLYFHCIIAFVSVPWGFLQFLYEPTYTKLSLPTEMSTSYCRLSVVMFPVSMHNTFRLLSLEDMLGWLVYWAAHRYKSWRPDVCILCPTLRSENLSPIFDFILVIRTENAVSAPVWPPSTQVSSTSDTHIWRLEQ